VVNRSGSAGLNGDGLNGDGLNGDGLDCDVLVIGAGPAGTIIAAALCDQGLRVQGLTATPLRSPWPNTYGIWRDELEALGLTDLLGYTWQNGSSYFAQGEVRHDRSYGLIDKIKLQNHFLAKCEQGHVVWHECTAKAIKYGTDRTSVTTTTGEEFSARVVIDASGHKPALVERNHTDPIAYQAAYGIVGRFSQPPVTAGEFVLMDFRSKHLSAADRASHPPTFLYAMDLGDGVHFVEETSLAATPAVGFELLERRLMARLQMSGIEVLESHAIERCLFPMNLPLPRFDQPVVAFGGAASMVHPASGYSIGAQLRRAPDLAHAIAQAIKQENATPATIAQAGWHGLWPQERLRKYYLYRFGLEKLMRFDEKKLTYFFDTFFGLPRSQWSGFLADSMSSVELVGAMLRLFATAPNDVRWGLMQFPGKEARLFWDFLTA
jgi:lycopene beta-cyclase